MIVARKKDDRIVVGIITADSLVDMTSKDLVLESNLPFWKVKGVKDCYVFCEDTCFAADLLRYNDNVFKGVTDSESLIANAIPKMKNLLDKNGCFTDKNKWGSQLLVVTNNKMFIVDRYFCVLEADEYVGLGFKQYIIGALKETNDLPIEDSIIFAVRTLNRMLNRNYLPLVLFDVKTKKKKVVLK